MGLVLSQKSIDKFIQKETANVLKTDSAKSTITVQYSKNNYAPEELFNTSN